MNVSTIHAAAAFRYASSLRASALSAHSSHSPGQPSEGNTHRGSLGGGVSSHVGTVTGTTTLTTRSRTQAVTHRASRRQASHLGIENEDPGLERLDEAVLLLERVMANLLREGEPAVEVNALLLPVALILIGLG